MDGDFDGPEFDTLNSIKYGVDERRIPRIGTESRTSKSRVTLLGMHSVSSCSHPSFYFPKSFRIAFATDEDVR